MRVHDLEYHRNLQKVEYLGSENKVQVSWNSHYTDVNFKIPLTYDYSFVSVPFTDIRKWELPGTYTLRQTPSPAKLFSYNACMITSVVSHRRVNSMLLNRVVIAGWNFWFFDQNTMILFTLMLKRCL